MFKFGVIVVLLFFVKDGAGQENNVNVTIGQGVLNGQEMEDFQGGTFYSFQSIPYAKPPIGDLRFKVS